MKFRAIDKNIVISVCRIVYNHFEESPFAYTLLFSPIFDLRSLKLPEIKECFAGELPFLQKAYLRCISESYHTDYDGEFWEYMLDADVSFIDCYLEEMLMCEEKHRHVQESWVCRLRKIWMRDNYSNVASRILEYLIKRTNRWKCSLFFEELLEKESANENIVSWLKIEINRRKDDKKDICLLFECVSVLSEDARLELIAYYLSHNDSYDLFKVVPLEPGSWSWSGSEVPVLKKRIDFLKKLLPILSGMKFLHHKQYVESRICTLEREVEEAEIREMLED